mmetsp:Transcript_47591/g.101133  ORF Transcript_47591/g.101133 Transcript_47591/m.101133 type:complete len:690 (-) Transcript_47591:233-2302(-)|eukprot:CAMPEP_0172550798 /NCGR_PEP_ID=MMETSP1067-20121228/33340_1 /TAXON_ID=265564 ORGANISM="Thalassiosira punctigera, Strain Tpunct2005C2" /NCGR_SAMPLE_ID=MMETSP1067 /ASSEMBLY_ACC=CAM_ASM_000444 /LENGTH=689 /DNA_ID=CAMNT_0013338465 /DNA_START=92 /DNA_END=2161 /DNA_ORIENTATION=-
MAEDGRKKKKKSRRNRRGRSTSADALDDEEQPLAIHNGEAEFSNSATFNADNAPVVMAADSNNASDDDDDPEDSQQPVLTLVQDGMDDEDAIPAPIEEPGGDGLDDTPAFTEEGLAVATAIDASAEDEYIYAAIEYDPDSKPPLHKNRRFRVYTCMAFMVVIAVVVVVVVYTTKSAKGTETTEVEVLVNGPPSGTPTSAPTTNREASGIREQVEAGILQRGANFSTIPETDPRYLALDWILHYDQLQLDSDDKNLYQRYVLALLAFALDSLAWLGCGEHRKFGNVTENFVTEDCQVKNIATEQFESHKVWLSSTEECEWYGVICSSDEVVRGVELMGNGLIGEIPPEISQLRFLQYLALNGNCLFGTIPPEFGMMPNLLSLELHGNGLSGELPSEMYDASKLQLFNVAMQYGFSNVCYKSNGAYVNTLFQGGGLTARNFNPGLWGNVLDENVTKWKSMKGLHLFDNSFTGTIGEGIGDLKYLVFLRAHNNVFQGYLPYGLEKLKKLREVYLYKNELYDSIIPTIGDMEDLEDLRLHENEMYGAIPDSLYNLRKLKKLWLQDTVFCDREEPYECTTESDYGFEGTISKEIGNLKKLQMLLINNNPLGGTLPTEIGLCENLAILHIHKTNLKGPAPREMCGLRDKKLNNEADMGVVYADCRPNNRTQDPFFACDCCTDCCDHTTKVCIADD